MGETLTEVRRDVDCPPLVTFALFAFNQENYIRESVQGVLSQTYEPLEIILSDDGSSDRTYEIIREMAESYTGAHTVICRQSKVNLGTYNHVLAVAREAHGQLLIVNAGDDVSYPDRASHLTDHWLETGAIAVGSYYDEIDETGRVRGRNLCFPPSEAAQIVFGKSVKTHKVDGLVVTSPGFSAGYDTAFLKSLDFAPGKLLIEDGTIQGIVNCQGGIISIIPESLIAYRTHSGSLTVRNDSSSRDALRRREEKISSLGESIKLMIGQIISEASKNGQEIEPVVASGLARGRRYAETIDGFWNETVFGRFRRLARCRSAEDFRFCLPRLFGFEFFVGIKKAATYLRRQRST